MCLQNRLEFLIKWKYYGEEENKWTRLSDLCNPSQTLLHNPRPCGGLWGLQGGLPRGPVGWQGAME